MTSTVAVDANLAATALDDALRDSKTHACALYELVKFDKAVEHDGLLVAGDACACILAVEV